MRALRIAARVLCLVLSAAFVVGCGAGRSLFGRKRGVTKQVSIEWRHLVVDSGTCLRCGETGRTLDTVVADLNRELAPAGVKVAFSEVKLGPERIAESNSILFNNVPLESLLPDLRVVYNTCQSCCGMVGKPVECRAVEFRGKTYDEVPEAAIRAAAFKAAGLTAEPVRKMP